MKVIDIQHEAEAPILPDKRSSRKPKTGAELLAILEESGLIGVWEDREDIGDSSEYARKLRKQAETPMKD